MTLVEISLERILVSLRLHTAPKTSFRQLILVSFIRSSSALVQRAY
jgi:hypothetical protein